MSLPPFLRPEDVIPQLKNAIALGLTINKSYNGTPPNINWEFVVKDLSNNTVFTTQLGINKPARLAELNAAKDDLQAQIDELDEEIDDLNTYQGQM